MFLMKMVKLDKIELQGTDGKFRLRQVSSFTMFRTITHACFYNNQTRHK